MKALIFGATGMVGNEVLDLCLADNNITQLVTLGRRCTGREHLKLREIVHSDFMDYSASIPVLLEADICFYCLGVYQNQVSKDEFWKITVDYLEALVCEFENCNPEIIFCLFSAQGADPKEKSIFRFGNAKGRAEKLLTNSGIRKTYIFRPGFIKPPTNKGRSSGPLLWAFLPLYKLLPGIGIDATDLARVMVQVALNGSDASLFENSDMRLITQKLNAG